ncbi:hypothetical protein, partial [Chitinophaga ginsengisoli]
KLLLGPLSAKKRADLFEISPNFFDPDLFGQPLLTLVQRTGQVSNFWVIDFNIIRLVLECTGKKRYIY